MARAPRSAAWVGLVAGVAAAVAACIVVPRMSGKGGVEVVGPLERTVEVSTTDGGTRHVALWLKAEVRRSAVFEVYREETRATVKLGGDITGLDVRSVNGEVARMKREEGVTQPALERVEAPSLLQDASEGKTDVVRWRWGGVGQNVAALGATGLGVGMLGFGLVSIAMRVREQ